MADRERLFFALWPDEDVREHLVRVQQATPRGGGRATHAQDLHITLVFLGMVDPERRGCVEKAADRIDSPSFDLYIDCTGFWPRPRIAWCGPQRIPEPLVGLVDTLKDGLRDCGFAPEARAYHPHVTLARDARRSASGPVLSPFVWRCERFVLVTSSSGRHPPRYRVVREWALEKASESALGADS